jgi:hypothetical protein
MGPIFNLVYWFMGLLVLAVAFFAAAIFGVAAYVITALVARRRGNTQPISLSIALFISLGVGTLTFCGLCQWSLSDPTIPRTKPAKEDIIGIWSLSPSSLQEMRMEGRYEISTHTLTFKDDGTFEMVNMPDLWLNFGQSNQDFYSGSGRWEFVKNYQGYWTVEVHFTSLPGYKNGLVTSFYVGQNEAGYYIYDFIGDPDSGDVIVFEKL